jgi:hypothetical protein
MRTRLLHQCTLTNVKCDGERPACKACVDRDLTCEYTSEQGVTRVTALKRKFESLQAESADEHDLLSILRTGSDEDAIKVLAYLRSTDDVQATLNQARNIEDKSNDLAALDLSLYPPTYDGISQSSLQATHASMAVAPMYPELNGSYGETPWTIPIEPYVC